MMKMKKTLLALLLCFVLLLLTACAPATKLMSYAPNAAMKAGITVRPDCVAGIHFATPSDLCEFEKPDASVAYVPQEGYCLVFATAEEGFGGDWAVFLSEGGEVLSVLSYDALYGGYASLVGGEVAMQTEYLNAATFVSHLSLNARTTAEQLEGKGDKDIKNGIWYALTDKQLESIWKK